MRFKFSFWWLLCLLWAAKIFWLSTDTFSTEATRPLLAQLLELLHIHLAPATFRVLHTIVRKSAHLAEYGVFAFILYRAFLNRERLIWQSQAAVRCLAVIAVYSLSDEFHQLFSRDRGPSLADCAIDLAGAVLALLVVRNYARIRPDRVNSRPGPPDTTLHVLEDA